MKKIISNNKYVLILVPTEELVRKHLIEEWLAGKQWTSDNITYKLIQFDIYETNQIVLSLEIDGNFVQRIYRIDIDVAHLKELGRISYTDTLWNDILISFDEEERKHIDKTQKYFAFSVVDSDGEKRYIVDPDNFDGIVLTSMRDGQHSDYGGETLSELQQRENNPNLKAVTRTELNKLLVIYYDSLCKPFEEISEERYWELLECVPPKRHRRGSFFVGECYDGPLYRFCFEYDKRYFSALRSIRLSDVELDKEIIEFSKTLKQ